MKTVLIAAAFGAAAGAVVAAFITKDLANAYLRKMDAYVKDMIELAKKQMEAVVEACATRLRQDKR